MSLTQSLRVGYVVQQYPRYSETLAIKEMLADEAGGLDIEFFALQPPPNPRNIHPQNTIARGRSPGVYERFPGQAPVSEALHTHPSSAASFFWAELQEASKDLPGFWAMLEVAQGEPAGHIYQATWLARKVRLKGITHLYTHFGSLTTRITCLAAHFAGVSYTLHSSR